MSTEINETVQAIGEGCASHAGGVPELLAATLPEFLGGLAVALVTALAAWGLNRRRTRRAPDDAR
ncbi:hypothetical protein [Streptomyces sp. BE303]|uniref:hypothetical protein n=1 Tax=Streptomyces sp. BE303 TaxID=3002528 RepID=UPI002E78B83B|nr:hypothetical protein [Streptomyces sp. BE303]MED7948217.1 hypothetical protein [Streptomyces sp. BE303]